VLLAIRIERQPDRIFAPSCSNSASVGIPSPFRSASRSICPTRSVDQEGEVGGSGRSSAPATSSTSSTESSVKTSKPSGRPPRFSRPRFSGGDGYRIRGTSAATRRPAQLTNWTVDVEENFVRHGLRSPASPIGTLLCRLFVMVPFSGPLEAGALARPRLSVAPRWSRRRWTLHASTSTR
jgi:hypothetical protein